VLDVRPRRVRRRAPPRRPLTTDHRAPPPDVHLPDDVEIVAYCRGPYCVYADDAVRRLRGEGFHALRLADGFPEWRRAGLPVAAGADDIPRPGMMHLAGARDRPN
jgi:rhodanese-related sulfurtransferase